jgi:hypothetical protein
VETHADFSLFEMQYAVIFTAETFCYGDVLFRRRFVTGDVLLRRRSVTETFCMETFCRGDVLCGDVLYVRPRFETEQVRNRTASKRNSFETEQCRNQGCGSTMSLNPDPIRIRIQD